MKAAFSRIRRIARTHRRVVIAVLVGAAVWSALGVLRPASPPTLPVLVTTRALTGGSVVGPDDVTIRALSADSLPHDYLAAPSDAVGRPLTVTLPAGAVMIPAAVVSKTGLASPGMVVVPVTLRATAAALVEVGDRIDLLATDADAGAVRLAQAVRVVAVLGGTADSSPLSPQSASGPVVLVELPPGLVSKVAGAAIAGPMGFGLR